jgi:hypothetical protein
MKFSDPCRYKKFFLDKHEEKISGKINSKICFFFIIKILKSNSDNIIMDGFINCQDSYKLELL